MVTMMNMKTPFVSLAVLFTMALTFSACEKVPVSDEPQENPYQPMELTTKSAEFVEKGNSFAFEFLRRIDASAAGDYIVSPLSMQFLLGMILDGTNGDTAAEIASVLGYGAGEVDAVNEFCLSMLKQLPELDKKTTLSIANALVVNQDYRLKDSYIEETGRYYQAEVTNMNFGASEESAAKINQWASEHTQGMVTKIIDKTSMDMLAYLLNALYFKGTWATKFDAALTAQSAYTLEDGKASEVMMMNQVAHVPFVETQVFQAVQLPYGNGAFSMTVLLPKSGKKVSDVTAALKATPWKTLMGSMGGAEVNLWLPKYETKFGIKLNDILIAMGMPLSFNEMRADFSKMSPDAMCLSFVRQDAALKVDEDGTEAAAVSSSGVFVTDAGQSSQVLFRADHPFIYVISEAGSGAVLFAGRFGNVEVE